ncbi:MAG: response regulator [Anaerolineae bacterium]|nr:response regulator [Anaerolineae bacterium]
MYTSNGFTDILLIEDNPGDVRLLQEAILEMNARIRLHVVRDGETALAFLRREGGYTDVPRPRLVLLDLNLPRKSGFEVLAEIKSSSDLSTIPVIVFTASALEEDILRCYALHANCYIVKPVQWHQLCELVRSIECFWLTLASLPPIYAPDDSHSICPA